MVVNMTNEKWNVEYTKGRFNLDYLEKEADVLSENPIVQFEDKDSNTIMIQFNKFLLSLNVRDKTYTFDEYGE